MAEEKEKQEELEEINEARATEEGMPDAADQPLADGEREALKRQLEEAQTKLAESLDGWQRSLADFQNYRKRVERDNESLKVGMKGDLIKKVLPVLDDLERAMQNRPADNGWANGIDLIVRKFQNLLEAEGIKRIEAKGAAFDPAFHEAISHEPSEDVESGHVIDIVQNGYMLGERVIRPALVRVAQ